LFQEPGQEEPELVRELEFISAVGFDDTRLFPLEYSKNVVVTKFTRYVGEEGLHSDF
jgi:hypothetical protein